MRIELAGVPAEVVCRHPENHAFFGPYASDRPPRFCVEPTEDDLRRIREDLDRLDDADGLPRRHHSPAYLENNAIHALLAEQLVAWDVLLMHGSALCMDGRGYLFTAPSGTGKSTHARLWREVFGDRVWMINDDKPLLRIADGAVTAFGSPWDGKHHLSRNAGAPLRAIALLERDSENRIAPMSRPDAFQVAMRQALTSRDPATMARIVALERRLVEAVAFYWLRCNMSPEAAVTAWRGMDAR
ncbi:MAG: hypothetical protein IJJ45_06315 [Clostridia bacterium]|nr:hypothetical protein [Clostridia bacterium]